MHEGYSLELKSCGVVSEVGIVNLLLTSSFGATVPNISSRLRGYTTLPRERKPLDWC